MSSRPLSPGFRRSLLRLLPCGLAAAAAIPALSAPPPIPIAEIRPGMTGYGLTVFAGSRIDTFSVRVLGVQPQARVQGSLVMVEVGGHGLERSSIAQGMSGSPVYLDGRFAGAVAFGWEGALAPIGGVTPAAEMLALPRQAAAADERRGGLRSGGDWDPRSLPGARGGALAAELLGPEAAGSRSGGPAPLDGLEGWPEPLDMAAALLEPLAANGGAGAPAWLCRPAGLAAAPSGHGGGNLPADEPATLRPGAACAVSLVGGDADLGAIGTVTWVDGNDVLMMGHPLLQRGAVNLPLATADIVTILPSRRMSFKIGSPGPVVGAVHHDLRAGLAGKLGDVAPTVPVTVHVDGAAPGAFRFDVADDAQLTPLLVFWSFYNALLVGGDDASRQTFDWRLETTWRQPGTAATRPLTLGGVVAGPGAAAALAGEVIAPLALLLENPFADVGLASATFAVDVRPGRGEATITALGTPRRLAAGAASLPVTVDVRDAAGRSRQVPVEVELPASLPAGPYRVVAASAAEFFAFEAQRAPERLQPARLDDLWELLAAERSASTLVVAVFSPERPVVIGGRELAAVPGSVGRAISAGRQPAEQAMARYAARHAQPTSWALGGHAVRTLEILPATPAAGDARRP